MCCTHSQVSSPLEPWKSDLSKTMRRHKWSFPCMWLVTGTVNLEACMCQRGTGTGSKVAVDEPLHTHFQPPPRLPAIQTCPWLGKLFLFIPSNLFRSAQQHINHCRRTPAKSRATDFCFSKSTTREMQLEKAEILFLCSGRPGSCLEDDTNCVHFPLLPEWHRTFHGSFERKFKWAAELGRLKNQTHEGTVKGGCEKGKRTDREQILLLRPNVLATSHSLKCS